MVETLEKRAVKPSCWKRKTPTKDGTYGSRHYGSSGCSLWHQRDGTKVQGARCVPVERYGLLDEFKRMSGTPINNRSFENADVTDTMTVNGRQRHQDSDGVIVC